MTKIWACFKCKWKFVSNDTARKQSDGVWEQCAEKIFEREKQEIKGRSKFYNEELYDLFASPIIIRVTITRMMRNLLKKYIRKTWY